VQVRVERAPIVPDSRDWLTRVNRIADGDRDLPDVDVGDLHRIGIIFETLPEEDRARASRAHLPGDRGLRIDVNDENDTVERRENWLSPTEPVLVSRSVTLELYVQVTVRPACPSKHYAV
jgi:hypothetical protein